MDKVLTGIKDLDRALGGLPKGRTVLVTGNAGSGKTIFGLQMAKASCENGLKVAYMATEESAEDLKLQAGTFGWDLDGYEKGGTLRFLEIVGPRIAEVEASLEIVLEHKKGRFEELVDNVPENVDILIIDNLGSHSANLTAREFKDRLDVMVYRLSKRDITTLLIIDSATSEEYNNLAMFSVYGAFSLLKRENPYTGLRERIIDVIKMRSVKTPLQPLTYTIGEKGIMISSDKN